MSTFHLCFVLAIALIQGLQFASATYYCSQPGAVQYGSYTPQAKSYRIGEGIDYSCNSGYILEGESWIGCIHREGQRPGWSHPPPICKRARKYGEKCKCTIIKFKTPTDFPASSIKNELNANINFVPIN